MAKKMHLKNQIFEDKVEYNSEEAGKYSCLQLTATYDTYNM